LAWCKARKGWSTQLLIRFGLLNQAAIDLLRDTESNKLPAWYDSEQMDPLEQSQVVWWDETHKKCVIGGLQGGAATHFVRFSRDKNGRLDLDNGTYYDTEVSY
jgi:hypothetical protein